MGKLGRDALAVLVVTAAVLVSHRVQPQLVVDPDRYFHLAISRETAQHGLLRTLPQVAALGWDQYFPDKEFLFHQWTALGYRLGGERGVLACTGLLSIAVCLALYALCRRRCGWLAALAWVLTLALLNERFTFRLDLVRPHVMAILAVECLLLGLLARRWKWCLLSGLMFALAYHALYIPLGLAAWTTLLGLRTNDRDSWVAGLAGICGLGCGVLANPYFPSNLVMTATSAGIALQPALPTSGIELLPLLAEQWARAYGAPVLVFFLGIVLLAKGPVSSQVRREAWVVGVPTAVLWALSLHSTRATEYAVPLTAVFASVAIPSRPRLLWPTAAGALIWALVSRSPTELTPIARWQRASRDVPLALPREAGGKTVFNCTFELGSFLLYHRPDVRFLDLSDPSLLRDRAPRAYAEREAFRRGEVFDPYALIHDAFGASYVICGDRPATDQLDTDPRFTRLYPGAGKAVDLQTGPAVYQVGPEFEYPGRVEVGFSGDAASARASRTASVDAGTVIVLDGTPGAPAESENRCAVVRVPETETARHAGAELLALGGGPTLEAWFSGEPLYASGEAAQPRLLQAFVPLPHALAQEDSIDLVACAPPGVQPWRVSASFWTWRALEEGCARRGRPFRRTTPGQFPFRGAPLNTCFGPLAVRPSSP